MQEAARYELASGDVPRIGPSRYPATCVSVQIQGPVPLQYHPLSHPSVELGLRIKLWSDI